eukprot:755376-Hanusia_phi.AAC.4
MSKNASWWRGSTARKTKCEGSRGVASRGVGVIEEVCMGSWGSTFPGTKADLTRGWGQSVVRNLSLVMRGGEGTNTGAGPPLTCTLPPDTQRIACTPPNHHK